MSQGLTIKNKDLLYITVLLGSAMGFFLWYRLPLYFKSNLKRHCNPIHSNEHGLKGVHLVQAVIRAVMVR